LTSHNFIVKKMIKLITEKLKEGTLLYSIKKTIVGIFGAFWKKVKTHNIHYFLDGERVFTKQFIETFSVRNENHIPVGNYFLDKRIPLNSDSIVYSVGILTEISFDKAVAKQFDSQIFMYDPTPVSIDFMKQYEGHRNFKFFPFGLWIKNEILKFYLPINAGSASIMNKNESGKYFEATCNTLAYLMEKNKHKTIDVLKMDIEGAALPILEQITEAHIFPNQIVVEFERPINNVLKNIDFFHRVVRLCDKLKKEGYEIFILPRSASRFYAIELLCTKKTAFQN
jgi:FkbM family methyltransferase